MTPPFHAECWQEKDADEIFCIIHQELIAAHDAMIRQDRYGPAGYEVKLHNVVAGCKKAISELGAADGKDQNN